MGWFSDLRDKVLYPAVGFAVGGTVLASVVSTVTNADEAKNPVVTAPNENTVSKKANVNTEPVSGIKQVGFSDSGSQTGISPQLLVVGGFGIIVLILLTRGN